MASFTVGTDAELADAIKKAAGGDTIYLKPVTFKALQVSSDLGGVLISGNMPVNSLAPPKRPQIKSLKLSGAKGIFISGVDFVQDVAAGTPTFVSLFQIAKSGDIIIDNCRFVGQNAFGLGTYEDGYGSGTALAIKDSSRVTIRQNDFSTFARMIACSTSVDVAVESNALRDMSVDAMEFAQVNSIYIGHNDFRSPRRSPASPAHPDMIQFWTTGTTAPSTDIEITGNNIFVTPDTLGTQSIFMRNELVDTGRAGPEMYYRNVRITDNIIVNGSSHGITLGEADGVTITGNVLMNMAPMKKFVECPRINMKAVSKNVTITGNIQPVLPLAPISLAWTVKDNLILQREDATKPNYYGAVLKDPFNPVFARENFARL